MAKKSKITRKREIRLESRIIRSRLQIGLYKKLLTKVPAGSKKEHFLGSQIESARIRKGRAKGTLGIKTKSTAGKGSGKGKGWHGESARHSAAAKKGK